MVLRFTISRASGIDGYGTSSSRSTNSSCKLRGSRSMRSGAFCRAMAASLAAALLDATPASEAVDLGRPRGRAAAFSVEVVVEAVAGLAVVVAVVVEGRGRPRGLRVGVDDTASAAPPSSELLLLLLLCDVELSCVIPIEQQVHAGGSTRDATIRLCSIWRSILHRRWSVCE
mgnify:CR=1 FL=1